MDDPISRKLADLAPLTRSYVRHLAAYLQRTQSHPTGRPRWDQGTVAERTERRFLDALDYLQSLVESRRQQVYDLVNPAAQANQLASGWLILKLTQHTPDNVVVYPQRLAEWRRAGLLPEKADGQFDPQYVSCVFFARMIDTRKSGWLPRLSTVESYACWRQNGPQSAPFSYEIPIAVDAQKPTIIKRSPIVEGDPYLLYTHWCGAAWDDPGVWLLTADGAIRWVGEIIDDQALQWLSPQEQFALVDLPSDETLARRVLRVLARDRLAHKSSYDSQMM